MSFFATYDGSSYQLTTAGFTALVIIMIAILLIGCAIFGGKKKFSAKQLAFSAMAIALAMVTSMIKLFDMPMGGSVTLLSMLFIVLIGYWYGRVMVERLEGFCNENEWQRAYNEINEFEKELSDWGAVVIKFWVQIDKDTQLARFNDRQNTPEKQWKITDEDWRNREKWDLYETAVNEMLKKTNTTYAPWHVLESNDKKYARIKALKIVIEEIEKRINSVNN